MVHDIVNQVCMNQVSSSCFGLLKEIKMKLKDWSKNRNYDAKRVIKDLESKIQLIDEKQGDNISKLKIQEQLLQAYQNEVIQLKQKSRLQWDIEGDGNSRFFHKMIQVRRQTNNIKSIRCQNEMINNVEGIKKSHFE